MPNRQKLNLQLPLKGVTENAPYSGTPGGFSPRALNVVGFDVAQERMRMGKRPGTARAVRDPVDDSERPVTRLGQITLASDQFIDGATFFDDPDWETPGWGWQFPDLEWPDFEYELPDDPFTPVTPPPEIESFSGVVDGDDITLSWSAV